ncbi:MAG: flippase [Chloroflexota bacterium]
MAAGVLLTALAAAVLLRHRPDWGGSALQRVAKNSLFPMATSFLNKFLDMGFAVYMFRVLGAEGVGSYSYAVVVIGYLDILANFGLGTLLTREVARDRSCASRYLGNTLALRLGLWSASLPLVALLLGPAAAPMGITPEVGLAILLLTVGLLPSLVASTLSSLFQAYERFEYPAMVTVFTTLLKIGLQVVALMAGWGFVGLAGVSVVSNLATVAMLAALVSGITIDRGGDRPVAPAGSVLSLDLGFCRKLLKVSYPLMLNNLLNSVFFRLDSLMLMPMAGAAALGWYSTAYKFIDGLGIISSSFTLALFPLLSQYAHSSRDALARAFGLALKLLLMVSLPISVGTTLIAPEIILLFAGPDYLPHSALALQTLIWFLPFSFLNGATQYLLIAINQQRFITISFLIAKAFNLATNLLLIPMLGYLGAAITTVVSEWVLMLPFWYCVRRHLPPIPLVQLAWRPLMASAIMGLEVWVLRDWSLPLAISLAPPLYAAALLALRSFDREERAMLEKLLPWGRKG